MVAIASIPADAPCRANLRPSYLGLIANALGFGSANVPGGDENI